VSGSEHHKLPSACKAASELKLPSDSERMEEINMDKLKLFVALGGNALQESGTPATAEAQLDVVK